MKNEVPILFKNKEDCCGCSSCYSTCPNGAISMKYDKEGFEYPYIDSSKCIKCNMCVEACPMINVDF